MKETIEEAACKALGYDYNDWVSLFSKDKSTVIYSEVTNWCKGAKWQAERSQKIVPSDAYNIEVFAIKPDENGQLFAYIGYKISNGNFEFNVVPFTEPQERMYSEQSSYSYDEVRAIAYKAYCIGQLDEPTEGKFNQWINQFNKEQQK